MRHMWKSSISVRFTRSTLFHKVLELPLNLLKPHIMLININSEHTHRKSKSVINLRSKSINWWLKSMIKLWLSNSVNNQRWKSAKSSNNKVIPNWYNLYHTSSQENIKGIQFIMSRRQSTLPIQGYLCRRWGRWWVLRQRPWRLQ